MVPVFENIARIAPRVLPSKPVVQTSGWWRFLVLAVLSFLLPGRAQAAQPHAHSDKLPARKAGLWEVTVLAHAANGPGSAMQPAFTVQQCTSAAAEPVMLLALLPAQENCTETRVAKRNGQDGGYDIATECSTHGRPVRGRMALWGDLQAIYSGEFSVSFPQTPQNNIGPVAFQGRWLGNCRSGQKPGEMVLPNGITVNPVNDATHHEGHQH